MSEARLFLISRWREADISQQLISGTVLTFGFGFTGLSTQVRPWQTPSHHNRRRNAWAYSSSFDNVGYHWPQDASHRKISLSCVLLCLAALCVFCGTWLDKGFLQSDCSEYWHCNIVKIWSLMLFFKQNKLFTRTYRPRAAVLHKDD